MSVDVLRRAVEELAEQRDPPRNAALPVIDSLLAALESGRVRAAAPRGDRWEVSAWVKQGILLAFRVGHNVNRPVPPVFCFRDRDTLPTWGPSRCDRDVRIVPGGTTVRRGAFLGDGVVVMPPAYVNVGAYVGQGSMVDSHALVGSCAQIGRGVHLSAAAQVGGVLEPIGALPVIIEDDAFVGGGAGIYEGTRVGAGAVLAPGVTLTRAVPLYDLVRETVHRAEGTNPLVVPEGAVVVPGSRPASGGFAKARGLQLQTPVIVKYRDRSTDVALELEKALR
jgi:2,3,4,5-tetrahydropyridine-2-carboxylate N-succinyltransferase